MHHKRRERSSRLLCVVEVCEIDFSGLFRLSRNWTFRSLENASPENIAFRMLEEENNS